MLAQTGLRLLTRPSQRAFCAAAAAAAETGEGRATTGQGQPQGQRPPFEPGLLGILVCPLSKKPLRYDESTNELINEELGIAYPIVDGIPNMIPQAARMMGKEKQDKDSVQT